MLNHIILMLKTSLEGRKLLKIMQASLRISRVLFLMEDARGDERLRVRSKRKNEPQEGPGIFSKTKRAEKVPGGPGRPSMRVDQQEPVLRPGLSRGCLRSRLRAEFSGLSTLVTQACL